MKNFYPFTNRLIMEPTSVELMNEIGALASGKHEITGEERAIYPITLSRRDL